MNPLTKSGMASHDALGESPFYSGDYDISQTEYNIDTQTYGGMFQTPP
jgi:hypothetical protein